MDIAYSLQSIESIEMFIEGMPCQLKMQQTQAKQLVKKLQTMRSPMASLLEKRVDLVERLQILQLKKVRGIPRPELVQHLTCMDEAKVALPLRVRLDVFECQVAESLGDILCGSGQESVVDVVKRFYYWTPPQGELKESRLTMAHILAAEDEAHQRMLLSGEITKDKEAELKKQISEASESPKCMIGLWFPCP